jgi:RNA recognition motif-containing protein
MSLLSRAADFFKRKKRREITDVECEMNIYVGNLSYQTTEDQLRQAFEAFGQVTSVNIIKDKYSGESKGFGFVEMAGKEEAEEAMAALNGKELNGRNMSVSEARPRKEGGGGGGGRGGDSRRPRRGYRENW